MYCNTLYSENDFYFEGPLQTAALLSMTGVGCIVGNQWYTSISDNLKLTTSLIKGKEYIV